jgi:coenzyme F420-reducing hydrogenase delta subunit
LTQPKAIVVFTCNWNAYSGLESAGVQRLPYSPAILPIKVACLGQISPGTILNAFQKGADGVLLLGCPPDECHYEFGNRRAEEVFNETKRLARLLGVKDTQLVLEWVGAGEGAVFVKKVQDMLSGLDGDQG